MRWMKPAVSEPVERLADLELDEPRLVDERGHVARPSISGVSWC